MTDFGERRRVLPKTGQATSYRDGDDGYYQKGWFNGPRFKDVGNGTVVDSATGLMWPKDANGPGGNNGDTNDWPAALDYAEGLDFAGHTDWRLPNAQELHSVLDYGLVQVQVCAIIQNAQNKSLWTSTTSGNTSNDARVWTGSFISYVYFAKVNIYYFICCRDA